MNNKPRRPWLAALLTILEIGLGHLYSGKPQRGLILFCIGHLLTLIFVVSLIVIAPNALYMIVALVALLAFTVYCLVDAVLTAKRNKGNYTLAKYNRWFVYVGYLFIAWIVFLAGDSFIVTPYLIEAYKMPTGSMETTLLIGDHLLVNKHIYRTSEPKRGDLVVFRYPLRPEVSYVKRLIGLPGDTVEMVGRAVYVNGESLKEKYAQYVDPGSINEHYGPYHVPAEQYFVLGDNRDNSQDSRFWGSVPRGYMLGRAFMICWSFETPRDAYLPTSTSVRLRRSADAFLNFFAKVRWDRTFQVIE
jgi:signal peptidase I